MNRDIPNPVKKILRQEVNYGCPVPDCGNPLLTWHHFDPPWHIKNHHNPEGMIALCTTHHLMADAGIFSNEQLHSFKRNPNSISSIKNKFEWYPENCLIRLGGCYAFDWCRVTIKNAPILEITKNGIGLTCINLVLEDENKALLVEMENNNFVTYTENVHDISISASSNRIKVWSAERKIGLECHYSRKTPEEIENLINSDTPEMLDFVGQPEPINNLSSFYEELSNIDDYMQIALMGIGRRDANGTFVRWYAAKHMGADGKIPIIDFVSCRLCKDGRCVELRNGRFGSLEFCSGNTFEL